MKTMTKWLLYAFFKFEVKANIFSILMFPAVVIASLAGMYGFATAIVLIAITISAAGEVCYNQFFPEKDNDKS